MLCALLVASGLAIYLAGILTGVFAVFVLERPAPAEEKPPILSDP